MKFCFSSSDGATIAILLMCSAFFEKGLSTELNEANTTAVSEIVEIPCSLDDTNGNRTDCNNSSMDSSGFPEPGRTLYPNSTDDSRSTLCPPNGCRTSDEQGNITTPLKISSIGTFGSFSETDDQLETTAMTEHFTPTSSARDETNFSCPLGGCLESNGSEPTIADATNPDNQTEGFETSHSVITTVVNETLTYQTSSSNDSETAKTTEATLNSTDTSELVPTEYFENSSMTATEFDHSNASSSHTVEVNNSTLTELSTITDEENASLSAVTTTSESFENITDLVENTTYSYFFTTAHNFSDSDRDATSPDNATLNSSSSMNSSTSVDETTEFSTITPLVSSTDATATAIMESPSVLPLRIIIELKINCSDNGREREIDLVVAHLLNATLKNDSEKECNNLHNVSLSIVHGSIDITMIRGILSDKLRNAEVIRIIYESSVNTTSKTITPPPPDSVTQSEMILYITLGVSLGAIFLIALVIICFKCCRRRPSKPVDLDVPHLNLRLEDYSLTRIPRPNTCYLDYFRGPIVSDNYSAPSVRSSVNAASDANRGMVQPFDTSVVPLEDAKKLDQLATSPNRTSCPSTPLRTFGRKDWKHGDKLIYENVISSSTEKLHPDFYKYGYPGTENPTFSA